jgi:hypothetical protein
MAIIGNNPTNTQTQMEGRRMKEIVFQGVTRKVADETNPASFKELSKEREFALVEAAKKVYTDEMDISFCYHPVYQDALFTLRLV